MLLFQPFFFFALGSLWLCLQFIYPSFRAFGWSRCEICNNLPFGLEFVTDLAAWPRTKHCPLWTTASPSAKWGRGSLVFKTLNYLSSMPLGKPPSFQKYVSLGVNCQMESFLINKRHSQILMSCITRPEGAGCLLECPCVWTLSGPLVGIVLFPQMTPQHQQSAVVSFLSF